MLARRPSSLTRGASGIRDIAGIAREDCAACCVSFLEATNRAAAPAIRREMKGEAAMEQPRPRLRLVVAALCVVAVLFACSTPTTVRLSTAPAEKLGLSLNFTHLLTPSAQVIVDAVLRSSSGNPVELTGKQHLTVNDRNED